MLLLCWRWPGVWIKADASFPLPRGNHKLHQQNKTKGFALRTCLHTWPERLEIRRLYPGLASNEHVNPRQNVRTALRVCHHV